MRGYKNIFVINKVRFLDLLRLYNQPVMMNKLESSRVLKRLSHIHTFVNIPARLLKNTLRYQDREIHNSVNGG